MNAVTARAPAFVAAIGLALVGRPAMATTYASATDLINAFTSPPADHIITIADGTYVMPNKLETGADGTASAPIRVTGSSAAKVTLVFGDTDEGIRIQNKFWTIENIHIDSNCTSCSGAGVHVKIGSDDFTMQNAIVSNFYQGLKTDRDNTDTAQSNRGRIINNELYVDIALADASTLVDVDGGDDWIIANNFIHDFGTASANYGMFVKGGNNGALISGNLIACALDHPATGGAHVGLSFGGGGMGPQFCPPDNVTSEGCACETFNGLAINNVIMHCTDDGLHTKRACTSRFAFNTVIDVGAGLQIQEKGAGAGIDVIGNVIQGHITGDATGITTANVTSVNIFDVDPAVYANPGAGDFHAGAQASAIAGATESTYAPTDYCGTTRSATTTYGAFQEPAACDALPWTARAFGGAPDGGPTDGGDSGPSGGDGDPTGGTTGGDSGHSGGDGTTPSTGGDSSPSGGNGGTTGASDSNGEVSTATVTGGCAAVSMSSALTLLAGLLPLLRRRRRD